MLQADIAKFLASVGFKADEKSLGSALAKVAAFGASVKLIAAGVTAGIMRVATSQVQVARDADKLRTSTERLEELRYTAEQTGAETGALDAALKGLGDKYPRIKDTSVLFDRMGAALRGMTEQQQKAYARRMGIDPSLIPMLTRDVSALSAEFRQMYDLAGSDAKQATEASKGFLAEIGKIRTMAGYMAKAVSMAFIGRVRGDLESLRRAVMENFGSIRKVLEFFVGLVLRVSGVISAFVYRAIKIVSAIIACFDKLDDGTRKLIVGAGALLAAWKLLNLGFLATPLGALIALLTAIVALVDDYLTFMEGGESYFDWSPWAGTIESVLSALKKVGPSVLAGVTAFMAWKKAQGAVLFLKEMPGAIGGITKAVNVLGAALKGNLIGLLIFVAVTAAMLIIEHWGEIKAFFVDLWQSISDSLPDFEAWASRAGEAITRFIGKALAWVQETLAELAEWMPDWVKDKLGMSGSSPALAAGPDFDAPALTPSPAAVAGMTQDASSNVEVNAKTEIHMHSSDPIAAGNQAAARQSQVNADMTRDLRGVMR